MIAIRNLLVVSALVLLCGLPQQSAAQSQRVSVNAVNLLWQMFPGQPHGRNESLSMMQAACKRGFTTIRFAGTPFSAKEIQEYYIANPTDYWSRVDDLFNMAKASGCKLIPSFFWNYFAFPEAYQTALGVALRDTTTQAYRAMWTFAYTFARRYGNSGVVEFWELGNELNLQVDLDLSNHPYGTANNFSTHDMVQFETFMVAAIRQGETGGAKPVSTGHSQPRTDAYHLRESYFAPKRDWTADSKHEYHKIFIDQCACCEICSMHVYSGKGLLRWGNTNEMDPVTIPEAINVAEKNKKTIYLGEFGDPLPGSRPYTHNVLNSLPQWKSVIPLSTVWVWEFYQFSPTTLANFSIIPGRDDAIIDRMQQFNRG